MSVSVVKQERIVIRSCSAWMLVLKYLSCCVGG